MLVYNHCKFHTYYVPVRLIGKALGLMNKYIQNSSVLKTSTKASLPRKEVLFMFFFIIIDKE